MTKRIYRLLCKVCKRNRATDRDGYCDNCRKCNWSDYQLLHGNRHERGYGRSWEIIRKRILERDRYLCRICLEHGRYTTATDVDHIISKAAGGTDADDNLQSLCHDCHKTKTATERRR